MGFKACPGAIAILQDRGAIVQNYRELLSELIKANRGNAGARYSGSFSRDRKETIESDSDFVKPAGRVGGMDYPGTGVDNDDPDWNKY